MTKGKFAKGDKVIVWDVLVGPRDMKPQIRYYRTTDAKGTVFVANSPDSTWIYPVQFAERNELSNLPKGNKQLQELMATDIKVLQEILYDAELLCQQIKKYDPTVNLDNWIKIVKSAIDLKERWFKSYCEKFPKLAKGGVVEITIKENEN